MTPPVLRPEGLCQVGLIVKDIEASARKYAETFGLPTPPIIETPGFDKAKTTITGAPSEATAKLAFFHMGQLTIELVEPDEKPSVWRNFLDKNGEGIHHIAFHVDDTKAAEKGLAKHGIKTEQQGLYTDASGMYTYVDSGPYLGVMIELLESFKK